MLQATLQNAVRGSTVLQATLHKAVRGSTVFQATLHKAVRGFVLSGTGRVFYGIFTGDLVALLSIENKQHVHIRLRTSNVDMINPGE